MHGRGRATWAGPDDLRTLTAPTLLVIGDTNFVRVEHAAEMQRLIAHSSSRCCRATTYMGLMGQPELLNGQPVPGGLSLYRSR